MLARDLVLPHTIARLAAERPDAPCLVSVDGSSMTYREVYDELRRWASAYHRLGVEPGDTVVTMFPNSMDAYFAWLGLAWMKAVEVPANNMYRGDMLRYLVQNSRAQVVVLAQRFVDRLAEVAGDCDRLRLVVVPDADGELPPLPVETVVGAAFSDGCEPMDDVDGPDYHDIAAMIYTSGTTGPSKGVLVPWGELQQFVAIMPDDCMVPGTGYYAVYPAFHVSGKSALYVACTFGGYLVIRESFSVTEFWSDVRQHDVTLLGLVGPMAAFLMLQPPTPTDADNSVRKVFMGPLLPNVDEFARRFGVEVATGYGMTEIGVPLAAPSGPLPNPRTCGRPRDPHAYPGYEVRVVDERDEPVPPGVVGELVVRARDPWVMNAGYFGMPEKTAEAWRNGWFHTGDGFMYDEDGWFYFVDRLKDAIRVRGENVSSFEVEGLVNQHPSVQESAAVAVPSEFGEDDIKVVVVPRPGEAVDPAALIDFLVPRMPRFMIPRYVEVADALPKTEGTFRTKKAELRPSALNERTWDRDRAGVVLPKD